MTETNFARWRLHVGRLRGRDRPITYLEAAELLGLGRSRVQDLEAGISRASGKPATPDYCTRVVMRLIADEKTPNPWPE